MGKRATSKGFTLIEVTIALVIIGLMVAGVSALARVYVVQKRDEALKDRFALIQDSLSEYLKSNNRYPCPADAGADLGSPGYGMASDCSATSIAPGSCSDGLCVAAGTSGKRVRIGSVPFRELNIGAEAASDPFGNRLTYAVTEELAMTTAQLTSAGINPATIDGAISITKSDGTSAVSPAGRGDFVLISHGMDGAGAFTTQGVPYGGECDSSHRDGENCDKDATFVTVDAGEFNLGDTAAYADDRLVLDLQYSDLRVACPPGQLMTGIGDTGATCATITCPAGQIMMGIDTGGAICRTATCPPNQVMTGINSSGATCQTIDVDRTVATCPSGQVLTGVNSSGGGICASASPTCDCESNIQLGYAASGCGNTATGPTGAVYVCTVGGWAMRAMPPHFGGPTSGYANGGYQ